MVGEREYRRNPMRRRTGPPFIQRWSGDAAGWKTTPRHDPVPNEDDKEYTTCRQREV
jgi:hypothetical protein